MNDPSGARGLRLAPDDPLRADVVALLEAHLTDMRATSPAESMHALDPAALVSPDIVFLAARDDDGRLLGVGALRRHADGTGEVKSMRTARQARGRGVAAAVLAALLAEARAQSMPVVRLETGSQPFFDPAVRLYARHGFVPCPPFAAYTADPNSRYLALRLGEA